METEKRLLPEEARARNWIYFEANKCELMGEHPNRWIAVLNNDVIAEGSHYRELCEQVILKHQRDAANVSFISTVPRGDTKCPQEQLKSQN